MRTVSLVVTGMISLAILTACSHSNDSKQKADEGNSEIAAVQQLSLQLAQEQGIDIFAYDASALDHLDGERLKIAETRLNDLRRHANNVLTILNRSDIVVASNSTGDKSEMRRSYSFILTNSKIILEDIRKRSDGTVEHREGKHHGESERRRADFETMDGEAPATGLLQAI
jgi:hypothetical protein